MRVLFVSGSEQTGGWLADALSADSATEVELEQAIGIGEGLARLRDELFDAVLIGHEGDEFDALSFLDAIRAGSSEEQPIIVLGRQSEHEMTALCYEAEADAYLCIDTTSTRTLIWELARATQRHQLIAENRQHQQTRQHRLQLEHNEAARLLQQQRDLISGLETIHTNAGPTLSHEESQPQSGVPEALTSRYRELLRTYVVMGSGNLGDEMNHLADRFAATGVTAPRAMLMHLQVLEEMVRSLGHRSTRHVMSRADLLILEMTINLAERYRERLALATDDTAISD